MKSLIYVMLFVIIFLQLNCSGNGFKYKDFTDSKMLDIPFEKNTEESSVNVEDYLPKNYAKDGTEDYTEILQKVINKNRIVIFPDFPLSVNVNGLNIPSNTVIYFSKNGKLLQQASKSMRKDLENIREWYDILRIYGKENIKIYNAHIVGNRLNNIETRGEGGAGIGIRNSKNILVKNCFIEKTWGDGIFVGSEDGGVSSNIILKNIHIDYSRRTGIALTSGKNVELENIFISNISGTEPQIGLDIEPSWNKDTIDEIFVKNVKTFNCANYGFAIVLDQFSVDINERKKVNINVNGYIDNQSKHSFGYYINSSNSSKDPIGKIKLENMLFENPRVKAVKNSDNLKSIEIISKNIKVKNNEKQYQQIKIE